MVYGPGSFGLEATRFGYSGLGQDAAPHLATQAWKRPIPRTVGQIQRQLLSAGVNPRTSSHASRTGSSMRPGGCRQGSRRECSSLSAVNIKDGRGISRSSTGHATGWSLRFLGLRPRAGSRISPWAGRVKLSAMASPASTPQIPFKRPQIPSHGYHKALTRGTLGGVGADDDFWNPVLLSAFRARMYTPES